jgi:hypothetical protein
MRTVARSRLPNLALGYAFSCSWLKHELSFWLNLFWWWVVPTENSGSIEKSSHLSCPAVVSRACAHSDRSFFHGSLVGFAAARNWSPRSLHSAKCQAR